MALANEQSVPAAAAHPRHAALLAQLKSSKSVKDANFIDESETELAERYVLPGAEKQAEEENVEIIAQLADEFTCASCFMVRHRSQLVREDGADKFCAECEG